MSLVMIDHIPIKCNANSAQSMYNPGLIQGLIKIRQIITLHEIVFKDNMVLKRVLKKESVATRNGTIMGGV